MSDADLVRQLSGWVDEGIPRVKMKVGTGWGTEPALDLVRAKSVRDAVGDGPELFVDANGAYTAKQAAQLGARYEQLGVTWFEEPVSSDHLDSLARLRRMLSLDVAAGEYGSDLAYYAHMCQAGAVDVVQADVTRCGGITEWVRIAAVAAAHGLQISGHCAPSLHAHVAASVVNLAHLEYFADHVRVERLLFDGTLEPIAGALHLGLDRPGAGLDLKTSDADRYRVDQ
jgi:L-alanine-DL-glutamate epimerase-like enolase superfamily enzyme